MGYTSFRHALSLSLSIVLAIILVQNSIHPLPDPPTGFVKLVDLPGENVIFSKLERQLNLPIFEPGIRVIVGLIEIITALLLLFQRTRNFAAIVISTLFAALCALHLTPYLGATVPLSSHQPEIGHDGGANFMLHIFIFSMAILIPAIQPRRI